MPGPGRRRAPRRSPTTGAASASPPSPGTATTTTRSPPTSTPCIDHLDLRDATLVGFSMGGGEVARYLSRATAPTGWPAAVFAAAVPPVPLQQRRQPRRRPRRRHHQAVPARRHAATALAFARRLRRRTSCTAGDRHTGQRRPTAVRCARSPLFASPKGTLDCIAAFGRTDFRGDLAQDRRPDPGHPRRQRRHRPLRGQRQAHPRSDRGQHPRPRQGRPARRQRLAPGAVQLRARRVRVRPGPGRRPGPPLSSRPPADPPVHRRRARRLPPSAAGAALCPPRHAIRPHAEALVEVERHTRAGCWSCRWSV